MRFICTLIVETDTPEQAVQVVAERTLHDEDYGFDYVITPTKVKPIGEVPSFGPIPFVEAMEPDEPDSMVLVRCLPHDWELSQDDAEMFAIFLETTAYRAYGELIKAGLEKV